MGAADQSDELPRSRGEEGPGSNGGTAPGQTLIAVRATVHLQGGRGEPPLRPGMVVLVDPRSPYIQQHLAALALVPLPAAKQPR